MPMPLHFRLQAPLEEICDRVTDLAAQQGLFLVAFADGELHFRKRDTWNETLVIRVSAVEGLHEEVWEVRGADNVPGPWGGAVLSSLFEALARGA